MDCRREVQAVMHDDLTPQISPLRWGEDLLGGVSENAICLATLTHRFRQTFLADLKSLLTSRSCAKGISNANGSALLLGTGL